MGERLLASPLPILFLTGPFSLIYLLVFSPSYLTALGSGDDLIVSPLAQTLISIAWMIALALLLAQNIRRLNGSILACISIA